MSPPIEGSMGAAKLVEEEDTAKVAKMIDELEEMGIFIVEDSVWRLSVRRGSDAGIITGQSKIVVVVAVSERDAVVSFLSHQGFISGRERCDCQPLKSTDR